MVAELIGIVSAITGIAFMFSKFYSNWSKRRDEQRDKDVINEFGNALAECDDSRVSVLLDAEFQRVRKQKSDGAS